MAKVAAASNCSCSCRCSRNDCGSVRGSGSFNVRLAVTTIIPAKICAQIKYPKCGDSKTDGNVDGGDVGDVGGGA